MYTNVLVLSAFISELKIISSCPDLSPHRPYQELRMIQTQLQLLAPLLTDPTDGWCSINWINLPSGDRVFGLQQQCTLTFLTIVRRSIIDRTQFVDFWKLIRAQSLIEPNLSISWKLLRAQSYRRYHRCVICTAEKIYRSKSQKIEIMNLFFWNIEQPSWKNIKQENISRIIIFDKWLAGYW